MTKREEIKQDITILRKKLMHHIIEECREEEKNINLNYDMGLITFDERLGQLEEVFKQYKKELKPFDDLYLI